MFTVMFNLISALFFFSIYNNIFFFFFFFYIAYNTNITYANSTYNTYNTNITSTRLKLAKLNLY